MKVTGNKKQIEICQNIFFMTHHLEIHYICFFINKQYSNKRMAPNNKWIFLTPLKLFYTSNYSLVTPLTNHAEVTVQGLT